MKRLSKFSPQIIQENVYEKSMFHKQTLNNRYKISKKVHRIESFNLHYGVDLIKRKSVVISSIPVSKREASVVLKEKMPKLLLQIAEKIQAKIEGIKYQFYVYKNKGVRLDEFVSKFDEISFEQLVYFEILVIEFLRKLHREKFNLQSLHLSNIFIEKSPETESLSLILCDLEIIGQTDKKEKRKDRKSEQIPFLKHSSNQQISLNIKSLTKGILLNNRNDFHLFHNQIQEIVRNVKIKGEVEKEKNINEILQIIEKQAVEIKDNEYMWKKLVDNLCLNKNQIYEEMRERLKKGKLQIQEKVQKLCDELEFDDNNEIEEYESDDQQIGDKMLDHVICAFPNQGINE